MIFRALASFALSASLIAGAASAEVTLNRGNAGGDPYSLDPHRTQGTWEDFIVGDLLMGLTTEDVDGKVMPGAAESWTTSEDGLTWTFKLREGAKWSDGQPVTSEDFIYAWRRLLSPAMAAQYASILYVVKNAEAVNAGKLPLEALGVAAPDPLTFVVTLEHPAPYLIGITAHQASFPVPKHQVEKIGAEWIKPGSYVSNGAFTLKDWRVQEYVRLEKNPFFYDAANVKVDVVNWIPVNDAQSGVKRYRSDELDVYDNFPTPQYKALQAALGDQVKLAPYLATSYLVFNQRREPFNDVRVREALSLAYDRKVIADRIFGLGEPVACSIVPPETSFYEKGATSPDCRIATQAERDARARELMSAAGYTPSNPLTFRLYTAADPDSKRAAAVAQAMWGKIGAKVEIVSNEPATHYNQHLQTGDFDVATAAWVGDFNDPETFLFLFESSNTGFNYGAWSNARYDELMRQERQEADAAKRAAIMREAEQILLDDYGVAPTRFRYNQYLVKPYLKGWTGNLRGVNRSRWMSIEGR